MSASPLRFATGVALVMLIVFFSAVAMPAAEDIYRVEGNSFGRSILEAAEAAQEPKAEPAVSSGERAVPKPGEPQVPTYKRPFVEGEPHMLFVLSYQRSGSSFFGSLFDHYPGGFYVYEPLDGLYNAMYGTPEEWNVPSDIMNTLDGELRQIPPWEVRAISKNLEDILQCRVSELPTETLVHVFWHMFVHFEHSLIPFIDCLKRPYVWPRAQCFPYIFHECPRRFLTNMEKQEKCFNILWDPEANSPRKNIQEPEAFKNYSTCMQIVREKAKPCEQMLGEFCKKADFRATKTVRATMDVVETLLERNPNLRVIHLIRDPRAVMVSRSEFYDTGRSMYAQGDIAKEAKVFCQSIVEDIRKRKELEKKFPGALMEVVYDGFVQDPVTYTQKIYEFLEVPFKQEVKDWVVLKTMVEMNSSYIATKWLGKLQYNEVMGINGPCGGLFTGVNYPWP